MDSSNVKKNTKTKNKSEAKGSIYKQKRSLEQRKVTKKDDLLSLPTKISKTNVSQKSKIDELETGKNLHNINKRIGDQHLKLIERTWMNPTWRRKWRKRWGKKKWKPRIRDKWIGNQEWRKKWMKKVIHSWWNKRWRRKWREKFLEETYIKQYEKEKRDRKRFWKRKWIKSGCKRMELTFNEFLMTQRNLRYFLRQRKNKHAAEVYNPHSKQYYEDKLTASKIVPKFTQHTPNHQLTSKQKLTANLNKRLEKIKKRRLRYPLRSELNPAVIQYNLYQLNCLQGLATMGIISYLEYKYSYRVPTSFAITGLFIFLVFPAAMDFFGSIFGMMTSYYLHCLHHRKHPVNKKNNSNSGFFCCCKSSSKVVPGDAPLKTTVPPSTSATAADTSNLPSDIDKDGIAEKKKKKAKSVYPSQQRKSKTKNMTENEAKEKAKCGCKGLWNRGSCALAEFCFKPGKSIHLIDKFGCFSYIFLQLAWFFNLFFTGYYTWVERISPEYRRAMQKCSIFPKQEHCYDFENLYFYCIIIIGSTFMFRNLLLFFIGMCISERYLKRTQSTTDPRDLPSTCSDTDIDYKKVPKQMLIPYLLSNKGRYPYKLPRAWVRPYRHAHTAKRHRRFHRLKLVTKGKRGKPRKRLLSAQERDAKKALQGFKSIRKATIPIRKGRRHAFKVPPVGGAVPDKVPLPPELMTLQARRWLSEEEEGNSSDQSSDEKLIIPQPKHHHHHYSYHVRKRRGRKLMDEDSLICLHSETDPSISEAIKPKIENLQSRISTDETWSGSYETIFESVSDEVSSEDEPGQGERKLSYEEYLGMMVYHEDGGGGIGVAANTGGDDNVVPI